MAETAAVNASPITYLVQANQFDLLHLAAAEVLVPSAVADEILVRGQEDPAACLERQHSDARHSRSASGSCSAPSAPAFPLDAYATSPRSIPLNDESSLSLEECQQVLFGECCIRFHD